MTQATIRFYNPEGGWVTLSACDEEAARFINLLDIYYPSAVADVSFSDTSTTETNSIMHMPHHDMPHHDINAEPFYCVDTEAHAPSGEPCPICGGITVVK